LSPVWFNNAVPKQQIQPYIPWLMEQEDIESFYLIGSDYVWPQTTNAVIKNFVDENDGSIVQEDYVPLGFTDWGSKLSDIDSANPDAVYFTVVGASQVAMIEQAAERGLTDDYPWAGNIMTEQEANSAGSAADGIYTSAPYFTSLETDENDTFLSSYEEEYGTSTTPNFVAEASYWAPLMMAQLLEENNTDVSTGPEMKSALENETSMDVPQGPVTMNPGSHHCTIQSRAGQYNADAGEFEVLQEFGQITPGGITVDGDCLL
jgi:urea transport system substrate-binding protein